MPPPLHKVSFTFKAEGVLSDVFAYANGIPIKKWQSEGAFVGGFSDALAYEGTDLVITFVLVGLNGTSYKITCQFNDNGKSEDGSKPNPIEGRIEGHMKAQETVTYHI